MDISLTSLLKGVAHRTQLRGRKPGGNKLGWLKKKVLKHQDNIKTKLLKIGGISIEYKRPYEVLHTYRELFEDEIYRFTADSDAPLIIDCGANIGLSVLYFKKMYPRSKVIAFEPDAENFAVLQRNLSLNGFSDVDCRQSAVWTTNDDLLFASDGTQGSGIATQSHASNVVRVKAERLADILETREVDFLKIDIEGAEVEVLRDCAAQLYRVKNLFVEYHGTAEETERLEELLRIVRANFHVYVKMAADGLNHPFVEKSTGSSYDVQLNIFCYRA